MNDMNKTVHRAFNITAEARCLNPDCFVKRTGKGIYLVRWRGMEVSKYTVITTVSDL